MCTRRICCSTRKIDPRPRKEWEYEEEDEAEEYNNKEDAVRDKEDEEELDG